jgi:hypothetical protein
MWPVVSPDGLVIAFSYGRTARYPNREMRIIPSDGGAPIKTFEVPLSAVLYNRLRWSPDGSAVLYRGYHTHGLWRQDLSADRPEEIEASDDLRIYHVAHTTDGSLLFSAGSQVREIVIQET